MMKPRDFDPTRERERALSALWSLHCPESRDEWWPIVGSALAEGISEDEILRWCESGPNFDEAAAKATIRSLARRPGSGTGSLFALARAAGWQDTTYSRAPANRPLSAGQPAPRLTYDGPTSSTTPSEGSRTAQKPRSERPEGKDTSVRAAALWSRFALAPIEHGYQVAKGIEVDDLRIASAGLVAGGADVSGWLTVPAWSLADGTLRGVQFVAPAPDARGEFQKRNAPGLPVAGGVFVAHGDATEGRPTSEAFAAGVAYLAEGVATAASLYQATGRAAVACFGLGNVDTIARALRQQFPGLRIVLCLDAGAEHQAAAIAAGIGGAVAWVAMPEGSPQNYDANDYAATHGLDALRDYLLTNERTPPQRFILLTASDLAALPAVRWRVRGVLPEEGIAAAYGSPGSGKSFLALDLLAAIAAGRPWFGYRVKAAPVLYIALEGEHGIAQRLRAHQARHGATDRMRFLAAPLDLRKPEDRADIIRAAQAAGLAGGVLCIDTLAASAPGMDENTSADMGEVIAGLKALQAELGGCVLVVHHTGKDATRGLRGHSSLLGALDCAIEVTRTDDRREWKAAKAKDGSDGDAHPFRLEVVDLGEDDEGEPVTSCVVAPEERAANAVRRVNLPSGGNQRIILDALRDVLREARAFGMAGAPPTRPCIELAEAIERTRDRLACESDRKTERTRAAITGLVNRGAIALREGWLWLA